MRILAVAFLRRGERYVLQEPTLLCNAAPSPPEPFAARRVGSKALLPDPRMARGEEGPLYTGMQAPATPLHSAPDLTFSQHHSLTQLPTPATFLGRWKVYYVKISIPISLTKQGHNTNTTKGSRSIKFSKRKRGGGVKSY